MTATPLIGLQSVVTSRHKNLEEKDMADRKNNKGLLPLGSLVEDIIFEELVILGKPRLLYWALYWRGGLQTHVRSSVREHAEMSRAIGVALWQTP